MGGWLCINMYVYVGVYKYVCLYSYMCVLYPTYTLRLAVPTRVLEAAWRQCVHARLLHVYEALSY